MAKLPSKQSILVAILLFFTYGIFAQGGYIWDSAHTCQLYTTENVKLRSFKLYSGSCTNGFIEGKATVFIHQNGEYLFTLSGNFEKGAINGRGVQGYGEKGVRYQGMFKDGWQSGEGGYRFENGLIYVGNFEKDKFKGQGTMAFPYDGDFKGVFNDYADVKGTMYFTNGKITEAKLTWEGLDNFVYRDLNGGRIFQSSGDADGFLRKEFKNELFAQEKKDGLWKTAYALDLTLTKLLIPYKYDCSIPEKEFSQSRSNSFKKDEKYKWQMIDLADATAISLNADASGNNIITINGTVTDLDNANKKRGNSFSFRVNQDKAKDITNALRIIKEDVKRKDEEAEAERKYWEQLPAKFASAQDALTYLEQEFSSAKVTSTVYAGQKVEVTYDIKLAYKPEGLTVEFFYSKAAKEGDFSGRVFLKWTEVTSFNIPKLIRLTEKTAVYLNTSKGLAFLNKSNNSESLKLNPIKDMSLIDLGKLRDAFNYLKTYTK